MLAASVHDSCFSAWQMLQCILTATVHDSWFSTWQLLQCISASLVHSACQLLQYMTAASVHTSFFSAAIFFSAASCFSAANCTSPRSCSNVCYLRRCTGTYASGFGNSSCASSGPLFAYYITRTCRSQWPYTTVRSLAQLPMFTLCVTQEFVPVKQYNHTEIRFALICVKN